MLLIGCGARTFCFNQSDLGNDRSSVWNFRALSSHDFSPEISGGVAKCRLFSRDKTNLTPPWEAGRMIKRIIAFTGSLRLLLVFLLTFLSCSHTLITAQNIHETQHDEVQMS